jgi:hypothetical protein
MRGDEVTIPPRFPAASQPKRPPFSQEAGGNAVGAPSSRCIIDAKAIEQGSRR